MLSRIVLLLLALLPLRVAAQRPVWKDDLTQVGAGRGGASRLQRYRPVQVSLAALRAALRQAPPASDKARRDASAPGVLLALPQPGGGTEQFRVQQAAVMAPALADRFPAIKTYQGVSTTHPGTTVRLDVSPAGFHAQVLGAQGGAYYLDPAAVGDTVRHRVFYKGEQNPGAAAWQCLVGGPPARLPALAQSAAAADGPVVLRTFRLAVACTPEYSLLKGNTTSTVLAALVSSVNRVNGVYEQELAIRLELVADNDKLVFLSGTGPQPNPAYTNRNGDAMLSQNQRNVDRIIGRANYDVGHVFSTGGGGVAYLSSVCDDLHKAQGVSGAPDPSGDAFAIDYVAHELGHQFGATHTFHSTRELCEGDNRTPETAYEPGSGTTIMAYAGICSPENVQLNSDPYFHSVSHDQIRAFVDRISCGRSTTTANRAPVPEAGPRYFIPKSTPFALTGTATDPNGDALTYSWEEFDLGPISPISAPTGEAPVFRVLPPTASPTRYFPRLADLVNNTTSLGERLPNYGRRLRFRLLARDNRAGGGGLAYDSTSLAVVGTAGPFVVRAPTATAVWQAGAAASIRWEVAGTTAAPISAAQVDILLSLNGGYTYPVVVATAVPNTGFAYLSLPPDLPASTRARVMVRATNNIFFDISDADFTVQATPGPAFFLSTSAEASNTALALCPATQLSTTLFAGALRGFEGPVALAATGLPVGFSVVFGSPTVAAGSSTSLSIGVAAGTPAGTYQVTIQGSSPGQTQLLTFPVTVQPVLAAAPVLTEPAAAQLAPLRPYFSWAAVPGARTYELQVAPDAGFTTAGLSFQNLSGTRFGLPAALQPNTVYFWRVRAVGECNAGPYAAAHSFRTSTETCLPPASTTALPAVLPATAGARLVSTVTVPAAGRVAEVRLRNLRLRDATIAELEITLISPTGRTALLLPRGTCVGATDLDISFDDLSPTALSCSALLAGATVRPASPLHELTLEAGRGVWTLRISGPEAVAGQGATLSHWSLELCTVNEPPPAPATLQAVREPNSNGTTLASLFWSDEATPTATYYQLQRAVNTNANFADLAAGIDSSPAAPARTYADLLTVSGRYYYRIRACNVAGCSAWTAEAEVLGAQPVPQLAGLTVAPNPSSGSFTVTLNSGLRGTVGLRVYDALGRELHSAAQPKGAETWQHLLDLRGFRAGLYLLELTLPTGQRTVLRLVKE